MVTTLSQLNVRWIKRSGKDGMIEDFILDENTVVFVRECDELAIRIGGASEADKTKCDEFINWYITHEHAHTYIQTMSLCLLDD